MCSLIYGSTAHAQTSTAPQIVATPVAFSDAPNLTRLITVTYRDAQGASTLNTCWLGVNTVAGWTRAVWAYYDARNN